MWISCTNLTVSSSGKIDVAYKGYTGSPGWPSPGRGPGGGIPYIAGGYGGFGGGYAGVSGNTYGLAQNPIQPGSGGGEGNAAKGGAGGGAVLVQAAGTVVVDGSIIADGHPSDGGGGSGGAILIECKKIAGMGGVLSAKGGLSAHSNGASGGGGRIAVKYDTVAMGASALPSIVFTAGSGESANVAKIGDVGTLCFSDNLFLERNTGVLRHSGQWIAEGLTHWQPDSLSLSNAWLRFGAVDVTVANNISLIGTSANIHRLEMSNAVLSCGGNLNVSRGSLRLYGGEVQCTGDFVQDGGSIMLHTAEGGGSGLYSGGGLMLTNSASMTVYSCPSNTVWPSFGAIVEVSGDFSLANGSWVYPWSDPVGGGSALFRARNIFVAGNAGFDASLKGYAGSKAYNLLGGGPGGGASRVGGGHGGTGGRYSGTTGKTYGSAIMPTLPGSGGGEGNSGYGGNGGGAIWMQATGRVVMDGKLMANGGDSKGGGGSGGTIMIESGVFRGGTNALMSASGGKSLADTGAGGGIIITGLWQIPRSCLCRRRVRSRAGRPARHGRLPDSSPSGRYSHNSPVIIMACGGVWTLPRCGSLARCPPTP